MMQIWLYLLVVLLDCNEHVPNTVSPRLAGLGHAPHGTTSLEVCVMWVGSATEKVPLSLIAKGSVDTQGEQLQICPWAQVVFLRVNI